MTKPNKPFYLEPSARLQRFLGRELIADPNVAIIEFVKNGYDAGATEVVIEFVLDGLEPKDQQIIISDNGAGMTTDGFRRNWLRPGYSEKVDKRRVKVRSSGRERVTVGEKGLGRLAAGRLGERLDIYTRRTPKAKWLHVEFVWADYDDMQKSMREIPVPYTVGEAPPQSAFNIGSCMVIEDLSVKWAGKVPGRKVKGRADTRLGRLRQDLELLTLGLDEGDADFSVSIRHDLSDKRSVCGPIDPIAAPASPYRYEIDVASSDEGITVKRTIQRSPEVTAESNRPPREEHTVNLEHPSTAGTGEDDAEDTTDDGNPHGLSCGPFSAVFYYFPPQMKTEQLGVENGVFLYRDGVRVEPYGRNDWLGIRAAKASRQGHAPIAPNQLLGQIRITRDENEALTDMSNRQGLVENEAFHALVTVAQSELQHFGDVILNELVKPQWTQPSDRARYGAERTLDALGLIVRAKVHDLRQPLLTVGTHLDRLEPLEDSSSIPKRDRSIIREVRTESVNLLEFVDRRIAELLQRRFDMDPEEFDVVTIIDRVEADTSADLQALGVDLIRDEVNSVKVVGPPEALFEAVREFVLNGARAAAKHTESPQVSIRAAVRDGQIEVVVRDNGAGLPEGAPDDPFDGGWSSDGGGGAGLNTARELLALYYANPTLKSTEDGTEVVTSFPTDSTRRRLGR